MSAEEIADLRRANHELHVEKAALTQRVAELEASVLDLRQKRRAMFSALDDIQVIVDRAQEL